MMVNKITIFKKRAKGKKGNFKKNGKQVVTSGKKRNCPKYLADKKDGKVNKGIFDIHVIGVYATS